MQQTPFLCSHVQTTLMADQLQGGGTNNNNTLAAAASSPAAAALMMRDYRKGNWTVSETMVLIEAKKMDDDRRMRIRTAGASGESSSGKPSEPRWKWVEDYCWRRGCFRSQNQCNDKWDNLMRDYKKVRDYDRRRRIAGADGGGAGDVSYWKMDKGERKDRNLPSNMIPQIYEALVEVVERKGGGGGGPVVAHGGGGSQTPAAPAVGVPAGGCVSLHQPAAPSASLLPQPLPLPSPQYMSVTLLPAPVAEATPQPQPFLSPNERSETSDSETDQRSHSSPPKRRRRITSGGEDDGKRANVAAAAVTSASYEAVGTAISKGASIIAEALHACDEREERRHKDLIGIQERRLKIEETNAETNRKGIDGLVEAINKLADSIHALAASSSSSKNQ